jgi:hypothetical protein
MLLLLLLLTLLALLQICTFISSFQADPDSLKTVLEPMEVAEAGRRLLPPAATKMTPNGHTCKAHRTPSHTCCCC